MGALLVTGFEPFGGETVNASWEAARALDGWRDGELVAHALILPVAYDVCLAEFAEAFDRLKPDAILLTGQAARRGIVSVERFAHGGASASRPDNRGVLRRLAADERQAVRLESSAPVEKIAHAIRAAGIPARVSTNAGDYVCNHLYFGALKRLAAVTPPAPAVFLHLPATPEQTPLTANPRRLATPDAVRALKAAATALMA